MTLLSNGFSTFGKWYMHSVWAYKLCCDPKPFQPLIPYFLYCKLPRVGQGRLWNERVWWSFIVRLCVSTAQTTDSIWHQFWTLYVSDGDHTTHIHTTDPCSLIPRSLLSLGTRLSLLCDWNTCIAPCSQSELYFTLVRLCSPPGLDQDTGNSKFPSSIRVASLLFGLGAVN